MVMELGHRPACACGDDGAPGDDTPAAQRRSLEEPERVGEEAALGVGIEQGVEQRCAGHEQKLPERHGMDRPAAAGWSGELLAELQQHGEGGGVGMQLQLLSLACGQEERLGAAVRVQEA
jgi:hypothetical protein